MAKMKPIIAGERSHRLTALDNQKYANRYLLFLCECGAKKVMLIYNVRSGKSKSCGCLAREWTSANKRTHGRSFSQGYNKTYRAWQSMIDRCTNRNVPNYRHYGGRGIEVCDRWRTSFENFLADMGDSPGPGFSLDRINNDGHYEPSNCRWATARQQRINQRSRASITAGPS